MSKFSNLTKEELLTLAEKQEAELASKKYGLVWDAEREPEQVVLDCEHHLPVLKRVKGKEIKTTLDHGDNILILGDNYHSLSVLNYTHQGVIDLIYIDPPYNRGGDFWYNDRRIEKDDSYKHSLWLNFIEKRLNLAKKLLSENGTIVISIDDAEYSNLILLCGKIFNEEKIETMIWRKSGEGRDGKMKNTSTFRKDHEYLIFIFNGESRLNKLIEKPNFQNKYENLDNDPRGPFKAGSISRTEDASNPNHENFYTVVSPAGKKFTRQFDVPKEDFESLNADGRVYWGKNSDAVPALKIFIEEERNITPYSILLNKGTTTEGTKEVTEILGFDVSKMRPKPSILISMIIQLCTNKNSLVLDFFAGTGTTGHAVLSVNNKDRGNRKFIICTNNENNICEDITYPRMKNVINGYKFNGTEDLVIYEEELTYKKLENIEDILEEINLVIKNSKDSFDKIEKRLENSTIKLIGIKKINDKKLGLGGNLQYFKTDLIKKTCNKDQMRINLTQKCTDMLCVKENIFNLETEHDDYKIFSSNQKDQFLCVYYNFYDESFDEFLKQVKKLKGQKKIYMFSMDGKIDKKLLAGISDFDLEEIPQKIIDIYKQLVKMNIPVKAETIFLDFEKAQKKVFEDKEKDEGARVLRIVLEKTLQKIAQKNAVAILDEKGKEQKITLVNDKLKDSKILTKVLWEENKTYLAIGNHASHGEYEEYDLKQVERFYKHVQELHNNFGI
jgi:adenine-specific DNA-methyltransferase